MAFLFTAGTSLAALLYSFTPSLSTIIYSGGGAMIAEWALRKYLKSSLGNYYYVYEVCTATTPSAIESEANSTGLIGKGISATKFTVNTTANVAYYGSKAAIKTAKTAANATIAAGSLLLLTVTTTGNVMYTVVSASSTPTLQLYKYISKQEPSCSLEDFYEWETREINLEHSTSLEISDNDDDLLNSWQLIERKDELIESTLLSDSDITIDDDDDINDDDWVVVDDDYLFSTSNLSNNEEIEFTDFVNEYL